MLEESPGICGAATSWRVICGVADEEMPAVKRVIVDEVLSSRSQTENNIACIDLGFSEIESIARVVAAEWNLLTICAARRTVWISGSFPGVAGVVGTEQSR